MTISEAFWCAIESAWNLFVRLRFWVVVMSVSVATCFIIAHLITLVQEALV